MPKPEPSCAEGGSPTATVRKQKRKRVESCLESALSLPTLAKNSSTVNFGGAADSATQKTLVDLEPSRSATVEVLNSIDEVCFDLFCNDILSINHKSGGKS